jgi:hypothetical protein
VLAIGVLGVLLLNTAMQQQADRLATQHQRMSTLAQRVQELRTQLDWQSDPSQLAARAQQLHLRPVLHLRFVSALPKHTPKGRARVSQSRPGAGQAHGG